MEDIYRENILDHYQNPRNFGQIKNPSNSLEELNSFCGDRIRMDLIIKNDHISEVKFSGSGCAVSVASASMLTEAVKGKKVTEVKKIDANKISKMLNIPLTPTRLKCALLPLEVLHRALQK